MIQQIFMRYSPKKGAATRDFRISGLIFMVSAMVLLFALLFTLIKINLITLLPISTLPLFVLWFMGIHRLLWGGTAAQSRGLGMARAALTGAASFLSLMTVSAMVGTVIRVISTQ
jgi:hypothetical protein